MNKWQAPPITHYETGFIEKEKTNSDINPQIIKMTYTPSAEIKKVNASYVKYKIVISDDVKLAGQLPLDKPQTIELKVEDKNAFKQIERKEFNVSLKKKKFLWGKEVLETKKFKLSDLSTKCDMEK